MTTERWTDERLDRLASTVEATSTRLDNFIFEASRLFSKLGESQARNDSAVETLLSAITRLTQSEENQWQAIREMQADVRAMQVDVRAMQIDVREMQSEVRGLQVENRRILQRVFGDEF